MRGTHPLLRFVLPLMLAMAPLAAAGAKSPRDPAAVRGLEADALRVSVSDATGNVRFARLKPGRGAAFGRAAGKQDADARTMTFLERHGRAFGLTDGRSELKLHGVTTDRLGHTHAFYSQVYHGVPVFGTHLGSHFDARGEIQTLDGVLIGDIAIPPAPSRNPEEARATALHQVTDASGVTGLSTREPRLVVFREGLAKGVPGPDHLAFEVEVGNGANVREFVYVDAHTGKVIDRITGIHDALDRRAYDAMGATAPGPNYPASPFWQEGDAFPTGNTEADNMIAASGETHGLFSRAFGRDSFDGAGATMDSIFNRGNGCPNASWNGTFISFCPGLTTDDITAHEWGHAYTQYTHNLIYQWQPGALNEAYSDIWGETVDLINGRGLDSPGTNRTAANSCTAFSPLPPVLTINSPASIAGNYAAGSASFGAALTPAGVTGDVVLVNDGVGGPNPPSGAAGDLSVMDGCETPFVNAAALAGKIALVYRGNCAFTQKAKNAQINGAIGVIVSNHTLGGNVAPGMGGSDPTITIPVLSVGNANGELIRANLGGAVNATLRAGSGQPIDNSYRWLQGEEATGFGGAIRDLWNPTCYGDPGKVTDAQYVCSTGDGGGVHSNSGIPNHAYALLVDGGTYNGHTVAALGLTKAAHIYYRAQSVYQGPASGFADHADALEASCADLIGVNLTDIVTGAPSGQSLTASDCEQIHHAAEAVELRTPPTQCNFKPLLAKNPPPLCATGSVKSLFRDTFENGDASLDRWIRTHVGVTPDFTPRDWTLTSELPERAGKGFFAPDPDIGTCAPGGDESGVLYLTSPQISLASTNTNLQLTFDHWLATEPGWDGGNLKISVNGGPWQLVQPADFVYNAYNATLFPLDPNGNTNPLAGQAAFTGTDAGSVEGSWGRSIVDLTNYAQAKDKVVLRFELGSDGCSGRFGWYLDDVMAYTCR